MAPTELQTNIICKYDFNLLFKWFIDIIKIDVVLSGQKINSRLKLLNIFKTFFFIITLIVAKKWVQFRICYFQLILKFLDPIARVKMNHHNFSIFGNSITLNIMIFQEAFWLVFLQEIICSLIRWPEGKITKFLRAFSNRIVRKILQIVPKRQLTCKYNAKSWIELKLSLVFITRPSELNKIAYLKFLVNQVQWLRVLVVNICFLR